LQVKLNKLEYSLVTSDLNQKNPKFQDVTTRPSCNPLEPKYRLAKVEEIPPIIPKFIRDGIDYSVLF